MPTRLCLVGEALKQPETKPLATGIKLNLKKAPKAKESPSPAAGRANGASRQAVKKAAEVEPPAGKRSSRAAAAKQVHQQMSSRNNSLDTS